ncbi:threonine/serine exporter family protein, partial [Brevibacterium sp. 5221]
MTQGQNRPGDPPRGGAGGAWQHRPTAPEVDPAADASTNASADPATDELPVVRPVFRGGAAEVQPAAGQPAAGRAADRRAPAKPASAKPEATEPDAEPASAATAAATTSAQPATAPPGAAHPAAQPAVQERQTGQTEAPARPGQAPRRPSRAKRLLGLSEQQRGHGSARRTAERIARRTVDRIVADPAPTTAPIPIVAVLQGTSYQAPVEAAAKSEAEARMILDLAVDIGALMLRAGSGSSDVEIAVVATCAAMGLPDAEVDLTSTALTVHYSDPEGRLYTVVRVSREESTNYAKLASIHRLVADMVQGKLSYDDARDRFDAIRRQRRPYPDWFSQLAWGVMVASFINLIGGSLVSSLLGFAMGLLNSWFGARLGRTGLPGFFITTAQAAFTTIIAMLAWTLNLVHSPQYVVAGGIVLLLPTQTILSAVDDALTQFPLTAAARAVRVLMTIAGIVSGVALGLKLGGLFNLESFEVVVRSSGVEVLTTIVALFAALLVGIGGAVGLQVNRRFVLPAAGIGLVGFVINVACTLGGLGNIVTCLIAATAVGFLARLIGERVSAPTVALLIPGIYPLLQGMSVFTAVYQMIQDDVSLSLGLSALFAAITANSAIAVGASLGVFLARPLRRRLRKRAAGRAGGAGSESEGAAG